MSTPESIPLSSDEKLMGALAHMFGPLGAIIIWSLQKDKSRFVKFQALQALVFDVIIALGMGLFFFCLFGAAFLGMSASMFTAMENPSADEFPLFFFTPFMFPFMIFGCVFPFSFVFLVIRLIAAVAILNGRSYRYPLIGKWLDNFLKSDSLQK